MISEALIEKVKFWITDDPDETTAQLTQETLEKAVVQKDSDAIAQLETWFGPFKTNASERFLGFS